LTRSYHGKKILIVDDSASVRTVARMALSGAASITKPFQPASLLDAVAKLVLA
jgi:PleD family two-component response regulator